MPSTAPPSMFATRDEYSAALFVSRENELDGILRWIRGRMSGSGPPVCHVVGPPGFGKSWMLQHVANNIPAVEHLNSVVYPGVLDVTGLVGDWYYEHVHQPLTDSFDLSPPFDPINIPANNIRALSDYLADIGKHFLIILDEADQAGNLHALESDYLDPVVNNGGSLLVGLRSAIRFSQSSLRRKSNIKKVNLEPFAKGEAAEQLSARLENNPEPGGLGKTGSKPDEAVILAMLDNPPEDLVSYGWDIPGINSCLLKRATVRYQNCQEQLIERVDVDACVRSVLKVEDEILQSLIAIADWENAVWTQSEIGRYLDLSPMEAGQLLQALMRLDIVQRVPTPQEMEMVPSWRALIRRT